MTLILRPIGKGNWSPIVLTVAGRHGPPPLTVRRGQRFPLGNAVYRVSKVLP